MDEIVQILQDGSISDCVVCLKRLNDKKNNNGLFLVKQVVDQIGSVVNRLNKQEENSKQNVEKCLALIGMLVDSADEQKNTVFAKNCLFIESMVNFTSQFKPQKNNQTFQFHDFYSHYSFELAIYTILCLLEHGSSARTFLQSVEMSTILKLVTNLGEIIRCDHLYLTQELSLEIVLRICYNKQTDREIFDSLLQLLPLEISTAVRNPAVGISKLLRNMRDVLSAVNAHNPHVQSIAVSSLYLKSSETLNATDRELVCGGYLDICREYVCFTVGATEKLIRLRISDIQRVHFATVVISMQILMKVCPAKLNECLPVVERSPSGRSPTLTFYLGGSHERLMQTMALMEDRFHVDRAGPHTPWKDLNFSPSLASRYSAGTTPDRSPWREASTLTGITRRMGETGGEKAISTAAVQVSNTSNQTHDSLATPQSATSEGTSRWLGYLTNSGDKRLTSDAQLIQRDTYSSAEEEEEEEGEGGDQSDLSRHSMSNYGSTPVVKRGRTGASSASRAAAAMAPNRSDGAFLPRSGTSSVTFQLAPSEPFPSPSPSSVYQGTSRRRADTPSLALSRSTSSVGLSSSASSNADISHTSMRMLGDVNYSYDGPARSTPEEEEEEEILTLRRGDVIDFEVWSTSKESRASRQRKRERRNERHVERRSEYILSSLVVLGVMVLCVLLEVKLLLGDWLSDKIEGERYW